MDSFINKIFKNKVFNKDKMLNFGFKQKGGKFVYRIFLLDNQFELTVTVSGLNNIETKLTDCATGDLYTLHLVKTAAGTFVGEVREAYENSLNLIAAHCCNETYFIYPQSNRIADLIKEKYSDIPEFLWEKLPYCGVFRNQKSQKWYGIIMQIDRSKLDKNRRGEIECLNIKLSPEEVLELQKENGFYPAYHMNKKSWITVVLDETLKDATIMELIEKSYNFSAGKKKNKKG